jgi:hypothetical protein
MALRQNYTMHYHGLMQAKIYLASFAFARAKCVPAPFKEHNFSVESFLLRENFSRGNVREAESRRPRRERVRGATRRPYERIKSQLFSDFSGFPFPGKC